MTYVGVGGLILIVAGIVWMFAMAFSPPSGNRVETSWPDFWLKILQWASDNIARKYLPGVFMVVVGAAMLVASLI